MATDEILANIAQQVLGISTLETRGNDDLDFHDLAVWRIQAALEAAYAAGQISVDYEDSIAILATQAIENWRADRDSIMCLSGHVMAVVDDSPWKDKQAAHRDVRKFIIENDEFIRDNLWLIDLIGA